MKKVISYSLWGNKPVYNVGAIRNANQAMILYPDFECWFYIHRATVPQETIDELNKLSNVKIIYKDEDITKARMWRFESIDEVDVEINLSRDSKTNLLTPVILTHT